MTTEEKIYRINQVLRSYFLNTDDQAVVPAKDLMPAFVKAGIFRNDHKKGLPIRNLLRLLDDDKQLHLIPFVIAERKAQNTSWFFGPSNAPITTQYLRQEKTKGTKLKSTISNKTRSQSDEYYVLDLCDEVLGVKSKRQHRFPFLKGDPNQNGRCASLPVDAWYEQLNLVVEYNERQHTEAVKHFDKRMTVSGVLRGEQRRMYDLRKVDVLRKQNISLVVLSYSDFEHDSQKRLLRNPSVDQKAIEQKLKAYKASSYDS